MSRYVEIDLDTAQKLREEGKTLREIGEYFGVSTEKIRYTLGGFKKPRGNRLVNKIKVEKEPLKPFTTFERLSESFRSDNFIIKIFHAEQIICIYNAEDTNKVILNLSVEDTKTLFNILAKTLNYIEQEGKK